MNKKLVFSVTGRLLTAMSLILLLPMIVSLIYREKSFLAFLITSVISLVLGMALTFLTRNHNRVIYAKEGFLVVALAWVCASLIGSLPFVISGEVPSFVDALFETVSGFTTTGASVIANVESLSHGMLFWRSFTHWIGGMGVLVFIIAFVNNISDRSIHILRAEMPGPIVGKLVPRAKDTSKVLYIMYIALTLAEVAFLMFGGMDLFESLVHSFGTAGTGGFGIKNSGISGYSPYIQWVIGAFMLIFGVNFNLYYLLLIKKFKAAFKSSELWTYLGIVLTSTLLITFNIRGIYSSLSETVRHAFFQVSSLVTTTGFATTDFNLWPSFSKGIIFILLFTGACAGSTAGGIKVSRIVIMFKMISKEIKRMIHPRCVATVKLDGKELEDHTQRSVVTYFAVYMIIFFFLFLILTFDRSSFDLETNISAAAACFNNVGPGLAGVGPASSYAAYSDFSKLVLSAAMLFGRLEIFPILIAIIPSTWTKRQ